MKITDDAKDQLRAVASTDERKHRKILKCLKLLRENPKHPGLRTHKYSHMKAEDGSDVFQSYVENNTPSAYRVFWSYAKGVSGTIIVSAITPHP